MKNQHSEETPNKEKQKNKYKKVLLFTLVPLLAIFMIGAGFLVNLYNKADTIVTESYEDDGREISDLRKEIVHPKEDNVSVLIIGVDENESRSNKGYSRSDALILATLNKEDTSIKLVSIPRDSLVHIPEVGYEDKINHAHAYGGPKATIESVENLLDVPIDYFVKLNFQAFVDVVEAIDGINVDVPYEFYEADSNDTKNAIHLLPGEHNLNGEEALALARTRKLDNDIERGKRQMEIAKAVIDKSISVGSILKLDDVMEAVGDNMTTNMSFDEMKSFISYGTNKNNLAFETLTLEGHQYQPDGIYYWKLDEYALKETKEKLQNHLELDSNEKKTVHRSKDTNSALDNDSNIIN